METRVELVLPSIRYYHIEMAIEFTESAAKHGFTLADAVMAMSDPEIYVPRFDTARVQGRPDTSAWVGRSSTGRMIEVFGFMVPPRTLVIFHCMEVRPKTLRRLKEQQ